MSVCPTCSAPLDAAGVCPACLMADALGFTATLGSEPTERSPAEALEEDSFGNYTILQVLGQGGMGTVYLAEQREPISRRVAIKVVKPGMDTARILSRFEYERQSLARMDHPNIARVYEANATAKGRPYFVMEFIEGEPITTYCDRARCNTRQRLQLFLPVCQAVQHAHSKGILHRDIKPSNVLITVVDEQPIPKIIDFGISKALDQDVFGVTAFTEFGQLVGTPEYMSPEAADTITGDVDASSDVYSLGVLLYELLVGAVPFDGRFLRKAGMMELLRIIREEEAPPLTRKLTLLGETASEIARRRSTDPASLRRQVSGDLNWIVMKAVEKTRDRRYPTPSDLLADIQHHLADRPVSASPPGTFYRVRKFVKRHRAAVLATAAVVVALVGGAIGTLTQAREAVRQQKLAVQARVRAEQEAAHAREEEKRATSNLEAVRALAHSLLTELDDEIKPLTGATRARQTLLRLGTQYLDRMSETSAGEAYLRLGQMRAALSDRAGAQTQFRKAIAAKSSSPIEVAETYVALADVVDLWAESDAAIREADRIARTLPDNDARVLRVRSRIAEFREQTDLAYQLSERSFALSQKTNADRAVRIQAAIRQARRLGDTDAAEGLKLARAMTAEAEALCRQEPSNADFQLLVADGIEAAVVSIVNQTRGLEGLAELEKAVAIHARLAAADPGNGQLAVKAAERRRILALLQMQMNKRTEGLANYDAAIALMKRKAAESPEIAEFAMAASFALFASSEFLTVDRKMDQALPRLKEAVDLLDDPIKRHPRREQLRAERVHRLAYYGFGLANALRGDEALLTMKIAEQEAAALLAESANNPAHWTLLGSSMNSHAQMLLNRNRSTEAIAKKRQAAKMFRDASVRFPENKSYRANTSATLVNLSTMLHRAGDLPGAIAASEEALRDAEYIWKRWPREFTSARRMFEPLFNLRFMYADAGRSADSIAVSKRSVAVLKQSFRYQPEDMRRAELAAIAMNNLAGDYRRIGSFDEMVAAVKDTETFLANQVRHPEFMTYRRRGAANLYVDLARFLFSGALHEDAARLSSTGVEQLAALAKSDPDNIALRRDEIAAREVREMVAFEARDLASAAREAETIVRLRESIPGITPGNRMQLGRAYLRLSAHKGGQVETREKGLGLMRVAFDLAIAEIKRRERDVTSRVDAINAAFFLGVAYEYERQADEARIWYNRAAEIAATAKALEPRHEQIGEMAEETAALAARANGKGAPIAEHLYLETLYELGRFTTASPTSIANARRTFAADPSVFNRVALGRLLAIHSQGLFYARLDNWQRELLPYIREAVQLLENQNLSVNNRRRTSDMKICLTAMERLDVRSFAARPNR